jgi:hypothetical protein
MKVVNIIAKIFSVVWRTLYFGVGKFLIVAVAYIFGYSILYSPLMGNDGAFALSYAVWFDRFFPNIPFWYPLQGAGISIISSYPQLFSFASVVVSRVADITLIQSFGLIQFFSLIITSLGIYLFVWARFKNQTMAIIAGLLYYLSPMTYVWIIGAGFLAQTFSFMFIPYALLFFDLHLDCALNNKEGITRRLYFIGSVIFICLATLSHPATGIGVFIIFGLYSVLYPLLKEEGARIDNLKKGIGAVFWVELTSILLIAFWLYPLQIYTTLANRGYNPSPEANLAGVAKFSVQGTLGLPIEYEYTNFNIAPAVWGLAILSGIFGFFYSRKILVLFILSLLVMYVTGSWQLYTFIYPYIHDRAAYFTFRFYTGLALVLIPILGAFGAYSFGRTVLLLPKLLADKIIKNNLWKTTVYQFGHFLIALISIALVVAVVFQLRNIYSDKNDRFHYGPEAGGYDRRVGHSIHNIWDYLECDPEQVTIKECPYSRKASIQEQLQRENWPPFRLGNSPDGAALNIYGAGGIREALPRDPHSRIDITPNLGAETKNWPIYSDVSLVNSYNFQSSLIHRMWGYEQTVFFSEHKDSKDPVLVNELGKYFGIDYLVLNPSEDPIDKFDRAGWEKHAGGEPNYHFVVYRPAISTSLYSIVTQPKILLIGTLRHGAYEQAFRLANLGFIPYDQAFLVEGESQNVDAYSLEEMEKFDGIILHGYSYKNKGRAWGLIKDYVGGGGSLFISNGWQFNDKDWGGGPDRSGKILPAELPEPAPVETSMWSQIKPSWEGFELDAEVVPGVDINQVDAPTYLDKGWSGSYSSKYNLREGAIPVLFDDSGKVLIAARQMGRGRMIWTGMNVIGFAGERKGGETIKMVNGLITWLVGEGGGDEEENDSAIEINRPWPDKVEFTFSEDFENTGFTFRESYFPGWQATLISGDERQDLKVYRGGVGFMYVNTPKIEEGDKLVFEYKRPFSYTLSSVISILTLVILAIYLTGVLKLEFLTKRLPSIPKMPFDPRNIRNVLKEEDGEE